MKKYILILFITLFPTLSWAQAKLSVDTVCDFGIIERNKPVERKIEVKNVGNAPLTINNVDVSCACTAVYWTKTPIAPGGSGVVVARYDAVMMGRFEKFINIYSNAVNPFALVVLKGEVSMDVTDYKSLMKYSIGNILLDKRSVDFKPVNKGDTTSCFIQVTNSSNNVAKVSLMHLPSYITMNVTPRLLSHGRRGIIKLTLDTKDLDDYGLLTTSIYLARYPGDKVCDENKIDVTSIVLPENKLLTEEEKANAPDPVISTTEIKLNNFTTGKHTENVMVTNNGKTRLEIKKLQVFNPAISVDIKSKYIEPKQSVPLKIEVSAKWLKRSNAPTKVLIFTNSPIRPMIAINVIVNQ